jgi:hypothetical protein
MAMRKAEREGQLNPLSFRATSGLREALEKAASKAGRSLSSEIEHRLELSLVWDQKLAHLAEIEAAERRAAAAEHRAAAAAERRLLHDSTTERAELATLAESFRAATSQLTPFGSPFPPVSAHYAGVWQPSSPQIPTETPTEPVEPQAPVASQTPVALLSEPPRSRRRPRTAERA